MTELPQAPERADAPDADEPEGFRPYVAAAERTAEFTLRAVLVGIVVGVVMGAANAYLGLRVGLTVSASIPAAVIGVALFKILRRGSILETNMVQTVGSAGESLAAGVIFTLTALFIWHRESPDTNPAPTFLTISTLALLGGILGVLFMIPLRRYLIVREHQQLTYPEGRACAQVIIGAQEGGGRGRLLFAGMGVGALYMTLVHPRLFGLWQQGVEKVLFWKNEATGRLAGLKGAAFQMEMTPELLGVGFLIGPRIASLMLAGGLLGWVVLTPLFVHMMWPGALDPAASEHEWLEVVAGAWNPDVRRIGAGAVAAGGFMTLIKSLPVIVSSFRHGLQGLKSGAGAAAEKRTQRDLPLKWVLVGAGIIVVALALLPDTIAPVGLLGALLMAIFAFFFVTVSSRIVGLIGSSSNPVSGMTIATLLVTALIFVATGKASGGDARFAILAVGAVVCIAAAIAGDTSQDLKTGFLLGATPRYQQMGELFGVLASAVAIGGVMLVLDKTYAFGSAQLSAPQATLMKTIIDGVLEDSLPINLILVGVAIALIVEMMGLPSLALAVGLYLPLALSTPIMVGGFIRWLVERRMNAEEKEKAEAGPGVLYASGLIAGAAMLGVLAAGLAFLADPDVEKKRFEPTAVSAEATLKIPAEAVNVGVTVIRDGKEVDLHQVEKLPTAADFERNRAERAAVERALAAVEGQIAAAGGAEKAPEPLLEAQYELERSLKRLAPPSTAVFAYEDGLIRFYRAPDQPFVVSYGIPGAMARFLDGLQSAGFKLGWLPSVLIFGLLAFSLFRVARRPTA